MQKPLPAYKPEEASVTVRELFFLGDNFDGKMLLRTKHLYKRKYM